MILKNILPRLSIIIALLLGIFIGCYLLILIKKREYLTISSEVSIEINPFELLSIPITVLLTIYVTRTLGKKNEQEKLEKDILINYFIDFKKDLRNKFDDISIKKEVPMAELISSCKILRKRVDKLVSIACNHGFIVQENSIAVEIKSKVREIWILLTDTPRITDDDSRNRANREVKEGLRTLIQEKLSKVEMEIIDIEMLIFELVVKLNQK